VPRHDPARLASRARSGARSPIRPQQEVSVKNKHITLYVLSSESQLQSVLRPGPIFVKILMVGCSRLGQLVHRSNFVQLQSVITRGFSTSGSSLSIKSGQQGYNLYTDVLKPTAFGVGASAAAFSVAATVCDRKQEERRASWDRGTLLGRVQNGSKLSSPDLRFLSKLPAGAVRDTAVSLLGRWRSLQPHQQTLYGITGINLLVLAGWRFRALQGFMQRNFLHHFPPVPTRTYTLLTSTFSHQTLPHFFFNSVALVSFGSGVHDRLGSEQFLAIFVAGGLASSVVSHLARVKRRPGGASLGSSGAVYAVFAMMAYFEPQATAQFIFLPGVPIALENLFPCLVLLDVVGALSKWRILDHWGHLGGALFGYLYARYGQTAVWGHRNKLVLPSS